jgi:hypothetical protein
MPLDTFSLGTLGLIFFSGVAVAPLVLRLIRFLVRVVPIMLKWLVIAVGALIWMIGLIQVLRWLMEQA